MELAIFLLLTLTAGGYITSIGCRRSQVRNRRAGWHLVLLGTVVAALLTGLCIGQGDLFHPSRWDTGKAGAWLPVIMISSVAALLALAVSTVVVFVFRVNFQNNKAADK